jgi:hypothetical protein
MDNNNSMGRMGDSYSVVITNQGGKILHRNGTVDVADGEPVRLQEYDDLEKAKEFCTRLSRQAPFFRCQIYRGQEKVFEEADTEWPKREQERLRAAHTSTKRRTIAVILIVAVGLGFGFWSLRYLPSVFGTLLLGLLIFYLSAGIAFGSKEALRRDAEFIGTANPALARAAGIFGSLLAGFLVVISILHLLHKQ